MSDQRDTSSEDPSYALKDFRALMRVVRQITPAFRRSVLPRGRLRVGAAYSLFMCSVAHAIERVVSDNDGLLAATSSEIPRLPCLASLTRQLLEALVWFRFFAIQPKSEDEGEFRLLIANLHAAYDERRNAASFADELDAIERSGRMEATVEEHRRQVEDVRQYQGERTRLIRSLKQEIKESCFLRTCLCPDCQHHWTTRDLSRGFGPLRDAVFGGAGLGSHIRGLEYDELSSFVHAAPSALKKTFRKEPDGSGPHVRYFPLWSSCLAPVVRYMIELLPTNQEVVTPSDQNSVDECCCHYPQFLRGTPERDDVASAGCPTCWLRHTMMSGEDC